MFTNPKYLEHQTVSSTKEMRERRNQLHRLANPQLTPTQVLQQMHPDLFAWYSAREWAELQHRLKDFTIAQMNQMFTAQKLKQIPESTILELLVEIQSEARKQELEQFGTMNIVRWLRKYEKLVLGEIQVNIIQTLHDALDASRGWFAQKDKSEFIAQQPILQQADYVDVEVLMAKWKLDRKTIDKYFHVKRWLGYNVISYQEVIQFAKEAHRPQAVFNPDTNRPMHKADFITEFDYLPQTENLWFEREFDGEEWWPNSDLIETLYDTQEILEKIREADEDASEMDTLFVLNEENEVVKVTDDIKLLKDDLDKRSFERHVKLGYWEHYRIGVQYRLSLRQIRESALYLQRYYKSHQGNLENRTWKSPNHPSSTTGVSDVKS